MKTRRRVGASITAPSSIVIALAVLTVIDTLSRSRVSEQDELSRLALTLHGEVGSNL